MIHVRQISPTEIIISGDATIRERREALSVLVPGHEYTPKFKSGDWDGRYRPGRWCNRRGGGWEIRASRGLLRRLTEGLEEVTTDNGLSSPQLDAFERACIEQLPEEWRDYQKEAVSLALLHKWGRVALATNAGKGAVIAILSKIMREKGKPTLILCDELEVFRALEDEIQSWAGITLGKVQSGEKGFPHEQVVLAMVPTLARRLISKDLDTRRLWASWVADFECVLLDEADKATAKTWRRILTAAKNSDVRIGFSGTFPEDLYGSLMMDELMGPELLGIKNMDLVERGISARPVVSLYAFDAEIPTSQFPWNFRRLTGPQKRLWIYDHAIVNNTRRHAFIQSLIRPGIPTCVIVNRIDHGTVLEQVLPNSRFLNGTASKKERDEVLAAFQASEFQVLIVTKILDRGSNRLGHAVDLVFASSEGSVKQSLQRIGRGLRRTDNKDFLHLRDIIDSGHPYLATAGRKRIQLYNSEGFEVLIG